MERLVCTIGPRMDARSPPNLLRSKSLASVGVATLSLATACAFAACSSDDGAEPVDAGPDGIPTVNATVKIVQPRNDDSFVITPYEVDVPLAVDVKGLMLVPLGQEGADFSKGQVRIFVDGADCNDPGDGTEEPPSPYNRILPNDENESTIGMDYCLGGILGIDNRTHTLKAELWHGETPLGIADEIRFKTTFRADMDGGADARPPDGGPADAGPDAVGDAEAD
jgi:hypothetical protein